MKLVKSFGYAWSGLTTAVKEQLNLRIHLFVTLLVVSSGFYFKITTTEWILLLIMIALVISMELVNSAIENLTNLVTIEQNPLAGKVKDIAAAAVLVTAIVAVIVGVLIFSKYFF